MSKTTKEINKLIREAQKQGWRVKDKKKGYMLLAPDGEHSVMVHKTPSDHRWLDNTVTLMRQYGFKWKGK